MSKKLLEEQSIRKFMKIAGLQPLTSTFLKESEETVEEGYGKKKDKMEEASESSDETLEEVEDLAEGGGQAPGDSASRREDDKDDARGRDLGEAKKMEEEGKEKVEEAKSLSPAKPTKMKGAPASHKMKPAKGAGGLVKEEEMTPEGVDDVEAPEGGMDVASQSDPATEEAVKRVLGIVVDALKEKTGLEISMEDEGTGETEVEMDAGEEAGEESEEEMEGGDEALDESELQAVVAETVKRVKARLSESVSKPTTKKVLTKEALAKKVAARVAEKLKKR